MVLKGVILIYFLVFTVNNFVPLCYINKVIIITSWPGAVTAWRLIVAVRLPGNKQLLRSREKVWLAVSPLLPIFM